MSLAIKLENLSKAYRLGQIGTGTVSRDLERWWTTRVRRKEDPFLRIGEVNDRTAKGASDVVWSLKDVNLDIEQGQAIGIIGRNGAGKSTLLKLLSRVTAPTSGVIKVKGRIASLLEVGTGFHPELTGRENIFLNGSILGMRKKEIIRKFDEIVDFSGVERYVDTPVKRYSSGMYVRLAFAVAAHLESEILVVDEVLAVGDAEFQKKCLGKMNEVSHGQGRTILFVSHNMTSVQTLCDSAMLLSKGRVEKVGSTADVINTYLSTSRTDRHENHWNDFDTAPGNEFIKVKSVKLVPRLQEKTSPIDVRTPLDILIEFWNLKENQEINLSLHLYNMRGDHVMNVISDCRKLKKGMASGTLEIPGNFLNDDSYFLSIMFVKDTSRVLFNLEDAATFTVEDYRQNLAWHGKWVGVVRPTFMNFSLIQNT